MNRRAFIEANTDWIAPPHVPEIRLRLATEIYPIWRMTEDALGEMGIPPPYWAFAWAGGQAAARYLIDNPDLVASRRVLDVGSGSGLCAIAAAMSGAASVTASDVDPFALDAIALNADQAGLNITATERDLIGSDEGWDVVIVGDLFYEMDVSARIEPWCHDLAKRGAVVIVGDPGRTYLPKAGLTWLATYDVKTSRELEDLSVRRTSVYRVDASAS